MASDTSPTDRTSVLLCIVTNNRHDVSLMCAVSMLRLQTRLISHPTPLAADIHFVSTFDDALNVLLYHPKAVGMLVVEGCMGMPAEFLTTAMASSDPVVVGTYPLPVIDWDRVTRRGSGGGDEPMEHSGNVYNVTPIPGATLREDGYVQVGPDAKLGVAWIRKSVVEDIVRRHPEVLGTETASLGCPGVYGGVRMDAHRRFLSLWGGAVVADTRHGMTSSGPTEFGGCVGTRAVLR